MNLNPHSSRTSTGNREGGTRDNEDTHTDVCNPKHMVMPTEFEAFDSLADLALDVHWSWNHATNGLWRTPDPVLWDLTQNPWVVLQTVSRDQLERVLADPAFR